MNNALAQAPRLTGVLRDALGGGKAATPEDLYLNRLKQIKERRDQEAEITGSGISASRAGLVAITLGTWKSAPKPAREAFEKYIQGIFKLLGGVVSNEEGYSASYAVWYALIRLPKVSEEEIRRRGGTIAAMRPLVVAALEGVLGTHSIRHEMETINDIIAHFEELKKWKQQLNPSTGSDDSFTTAGGKDDRVAADDAPSLTYTFAPRWTEDEAVLATCGLLITSPSGELLLREFSSSRKAQSVVDRVQPRRDHRTAPQPSLEAVAAIEAEVFGGSKGLGVNESSGARWLTQWCASVGGGGSFGHDSDDQYSLATRVAILTLDETLSNNALAAELYDLFGEGVFDGMSTLLDQRRSLSSNLRAAINLLKKEEEEEEAATHAGPAMPSYATGVSVMSESEKAIMKAERKAERRRIKQQQSGGKTQGSSSFSHGGLADTDADWLSRHGIRAVIDDEVERENSHMRIRLGDGMEFRLGEGAGNKKALPVGTRRQVFKGYEEVKVPAVKPGVPPPGEPTVYITDLPEWAQLAFEGYTKLNRIQSRIFSTAFYSNENMLVCAPTGEQGTENASQRPLSVC